MWVTIAVLVVVAIVALRALGQRTNSEEARQRADGSYARQFIYVNEDGTARELTSDEMEYLNTEFLPTDGSRPYCKNRYKDRTPDGKIHGFLLRRKLPREIPISES
jgi:hypothetical protein